MYWNAKKAKKEETRDSLEEQIVLMSPQGSDMPQTGVEIDENRIYYYSPISEREILDLNKSIKKLDQQMQFFAIQLGIPTPPIELHIHSEGGSAFAGLAAYDCIRSCKSPVHTYIDGCAASAATLLFLAGTKRYVYKNSFMLIHQISSLVRGKFEEMKDELKNQEKLMHTVKNIYLETSKMSEEEIVELMKRELWMDSETIINNGFADQIL